MLQFECKIGICGEFVKMRTPLFDFVRNSRFWKVSGSVEAFKFGLYLMIPVGASVFYANEKFMHGMLNNMNLIRYPEEGPRPPTSVAEIESALAPEKLTRSKL